MAGTRRGKIHGVGTNDADYLVIKWKDVTLECGKVIKRREFHCPFYKTWVSMLTRCYGKNSTGTLKTYEECRVCDAWLLFSNFKGWMEQQDWEGKELDKDLLVRGNKVYSPEVCCFLTHEVNMFIVESQASRGKWPIGVHWSKQNKGFAAQLRIKEGDKVRSLSLGFYDTPEEAHNAWKIAKLQKARQIAGLIDNPLVARALILRYENYGEVNE